MTLQTKQIETAIHDIHEFFTDWVGGRCPGDAETFRKNVLNRLSDDLVAIMPGGRSFSKDGFAGYMKSIYVRVQTADT